MRFTITTLLVVSFVGVAVFGFFGMGHSEQSHEGGCIAASTQGADCPPNSDPIDSASFHLDAFKTFSAATFEKSTLASLLTLLLLAMVAVLGLLSGNLVSPKLNLAYLRSKRSEYFNLPPEYNLIRWLRLHENSPANL